MDKVFYSLFSIIRLTPARRMVIFQRMLVIATALGLTRLIERLTRALAHEVKTQDLLGRYRAQKRGNLYAVAVQPIDVKADHLLSDLRSLLKGLAMGLGPEHGVTMAVDALLKGIFPNSVGAITTLPYVEQVAAMESIVRKLRGIYAGQVALLGIGDKVELLAEVTREYRGAVNSGRDEDRSTAARAANERGHEYLIEVIGLIVSGEEDTDSEEHAQNRDALLAPLYEQIELVRAHRRVRRSRDEAGDYDMPDNDTDYDDMNDNMGEELAVEAVADAAVADAAVADAAAAQEP